LRGVKPKVTHSCLSYQCLSRRSSEPKPNLYFDRAAAGSWAKPDWNQSSQDKIRDALSVLGAFADMSDGFGSKAVVDPVAGLIAAAIGWGGKPKSAAMHFNVHPTANDGTTVHTLTVEDVPVDGFWSLSLYNVKGLFEKNDRNAYSVNNLTATPNPDGSVTVQFGGCREGVANCVPIMKGWNDTIRLSRPRQAVIDGCWTFPEAQPAT
jgi:para-nitrobenzyl esterase